MIRWLKTLLKSEPKFRLSTKPLKMQGNAEGYLECDGPLSKALRSRLDAAWKDGWRPTPGKWECLP